MPGPSPIVLPSWAVPAACIVSIAGTHHGVMGRIYSLSIGGIHLQKVLPGGSFTGAIAIILNWQEQAVWQSQWVPLTEPGHLTAWERILDDTELGDPAPSRIPLIGTIPPNLTPRQAHIVPPERCPHCGHNPPRNACAVGKCTDY